MPKSLAASLALLVAFAGCLGPVPEESLTPSATDEDSAAADVGAAGADDPAPDEPAEEAPVEEEGAPESEAETAPPQEESVPPPDPPAAPVRVHTQEFAGVGPHKGTFEVEGGFANLLVGVDLQGAAGDAYAYRVHVSGPGGQGAGYFGGLVDVQKEGKCVRGLVDPVPAGSWSFTIEPGSSATARIVVQAGTWETTPPADEACPAA